MPCKLDDVENVQKCHNAI